MTSNIKRSWFEVHKNPKKLQKVANRISKRMSSISAIYNNAKRWNIELPDSVLLEIKVQYRFYHLQYNKIWYHIQYIKTGYQINLSTYNSCFKTKERIREEALADLSWTKKNGYII